MGRLNVKVHWCCCDRKTRAACAQSVTLAARNNRDPAPQSLYYCLFAPHISWCCSPRTSRSCWNTHSTQRQPRGSGCNSACSILQLDK